jgi:hypothetical protein
VNGFRLSDFAITLSLVLACHNEQGGSAVVAESARSMESVMPQATPRSENPSVPRIERRPDGPVLVLPENMERELLAAVPNFRHSLLLEFHADIQHAAPLTATSAPFAAVGDFNGDGRADVAVDGHDTIRAFLLVLLTEGDSVRVISLYQRPLPPVDQRAPRGEFISLVGRGLVEADTIDGDEYHKVRVRLEHDAFEVVYWQKAAELYYWRDGRLVRWVTRD